MKRMHVHAWVGDLDTIGEATDYGTSVQREAQTAHAKACCLLEPKTDKASNCCAA
jgi:hypothetical protein